MLLPCSTSGNNNIRLVVVYLNLSEGFRSKTKNYTKRKTAFQTLGDYFNHRYYCVTFSSHSANINSANIRALNKE